MTLSYDGLRRALPSSRAQRGLEGTVGRTRAEASRLAKFTTVGALAFLVDLGIFNLILLTTDIGPLVPKAVSVAAATTVSWLGSRHWTFRDGRTMRPWREAIGFFLVNAAGLGIAALCLAVSHYVLGLTSPLADNISGNVVGVLLGNVFRYIMYSRVLFRVPGMRQPGREVVVADLGSPLGGAAVVPAVAGGPAAVLRRPAGGSRARAR